jgi:ABC-2 type transport system permease protein
VFDTINVITGPLAVTEQFKRAASIVLRDSTVTGSPVAAIVTITAFVAILTFVVAATARQRMRSALND